MPQSYNYRLLDRDGLSFVGTLRKVVQEIYDNKLGVLENTVTEESTFYYIDIPHETKIAHDPEGYAADKSKWQIWVDPDLDISVRDGDNPDEVVLADAEQYMVSGIDTESVLNCGYKTVRLTKREVGAGMI